MTETAKLIRKNIAAADEDFLIGLANKGTYKRACKDAEGQSPDFTENDDSITVNFGGEAVTINADLASSVCSCPSRTVCRHIVGALVLMKQVIPEEEAGEAEPIGQEQSTAEEVSETVQQEAAEEEQTAPEPTEVYLSEKDAARVRECAVLCRELLGEILADGLVRIPNDMPARIEAAAVRCHGVRAADAERMMRDIGGRLSEHLERRASFDGQLFAEKLCRCVKLLAKLEGEHITEADLGRFRDSYEEINGDLTILPVGARHIEGGEYKGEIYYFLDENGSSGRQFLTVSDLRPVYYESNTKMRRVPKVSPWDLGVPLSSAMKNKMVLRNAKISGDKLSASKETRVVSQSKVRLDSQAVQRLVIDDFRQIAAELDQREIGGETDRLFFIRPEKCVCNSFDKYTQQYIMEIEDYRGCRIAVKAKYRAETKAFIELLEKIGSRMVKEPDTCFTLLAAAHVEEGELTLFPIEIYDFLKPTDDRQYFLPDRYDGAEAHAGYAEKLLGLFSQLRHTMYFIVHCGLRSEIRDEDRLVKRAENSGMTGLGELAGTLLNEASAYRHDPCRGAGAVMEHMVKLYDYIALGERKLQTISALAKMQPVADL